VPATVPLLVLAGADDGCIAPAHFADAETGLAPGSSVRILADAGHFMHLDRPDEVARLVLDWFTPAA
jgi:pimeloyl-ACP methyl ester carboxylesterase